MQTTSSDIEHLQRAVEDYKVHIQQISHLHQETDKCLKEIQDLINLEEEASLSLQDIPQFDFARRLPSVLFIGSQNCGKSTLLNVFLGIPKLLPTDDTPCTSRIVRIKYSDSNFVRVLDVDKKEVQRKKFKSQIQKKFVVLEKRDSVEELQQIVEVGLDHPLLKCGIELIDSPGRNENDALDKVVEEFIEKGIVPLIVFVVDGNLQIRDPERKILCQLQDQFPNVSFMFVCSKVDQDRKARRYDEGEDIDNEKSTDCSIHSEETLKYCLAKKEKVFRQLKSSSFLSMEEQLETTLHFHGVSAQNVARARRHHETNYDTLTFDRFHCSILEELESALKKDSKKALGNLLTSQEMIFMSAVSARKSLSHTAHLIPSLSDQALKTELNLFQTTLKLTFKCDEISKSIQSSLESLSANFMDEAEHYQQIDRGTIRKEFQTMQQTAAIDPELLKEVDITALMVQEFTGTIKGAILEKTYNVLKYYIHHALKEAVSQAVGELIKLTQIARDPLIGRIIKRIFGASHGSEDEVHSFLKLHMILDGLLDTIDTAVSATLRQSISTPLSEFDVTSVGNNPRPHDAHWRRKVVQTLLSKLDYRKIASSVIETCDDSLLRLHQRFREAVESYHRINQIIQSGNIGSTVQKLRTDYVPRVAELAVRGLSLEYVIERGRPVFGPLFKTTSNGHIYSCTSPRWLGGQAESLIKVIVKSKTGKNWNQTMIDCLNARYINDNLGTRCKYHLQLLGWYFPEPDQFYLVMEKAEHDLLTALEQGLSWTRRKEVAVDVARGLEAIHKAQYVYQDLKPQNVMLTADGTAKLNLARPERPFEKTKLGLPFHISPDMFKNHGQDLSTELFDIYAFGSLLWVLCEGTGSRGPQAYAHFKDIMAMECAVCDHGIKPERPDHTPNAWWDLMGKCWNADVKIQDILQVMENIEIPPE